MLREHTVAIIGAGNIGRALLGGMLKGPEFEPSQLRVSRRDASALEELAAAFPGIRAVRDNAEAVRGATIVILAVKPQSLHEVIDAMRDAVPAQALLISVLAGITTEVIERAMGRILPVVRTMPNTPALVDEAATAIAAGRHATEAHVALATHIFETVGKVERLPEALMDAATGLSGSGPAYVYLFIEALTDAGVKQGMPRPTAFRLAAQTVYGAARLVIETGKHPAILRDEVTTPGGTAIAAVAELEAHGMRTMLTTAVATAAARSRELGRA